MADEKKLRVRRLFLEVAEPPAAQHAEALTRACQGDAQLLVEAEPLLLDGYRGMEDRRASLPPRSARHLSEALERLVQLYEAMGNASEAAAWRSKLEAARAAVSTPNDNGGK
jgi:hypothetical protein